MRTKTVRQLAWRFFSESHRTGGESSIAENYTLGPAASATFQLIKLRNILLGIYQSDNN